MQGFLFMPQRFNFCVFTKTPQTIPQNKNNANLSDIARQLESSKERAEQLTDDKVKLVSLRFCYF